MTYKYKFSYVIPTLNSEKTLDSTILSLKQQKLVEVRIIVVDSGSIDKTLEICHKWGIEVYYVKPGNMYEAINYGLGLCETEWVGYLNSDDMLYANSLSKLIDLGNYDNADIVYGNCDFIDIDGRFLHSFLAPNPKQLFSVMKMKTSGIPQPATIFRKRIYERLNGFDTKYLYAADYDFFARSIGEKALLSFLATPPVACFRLHENQFSQSKANELKEEAGETIPSRLNVLDYLTFWKWKVSNIQHYFIRAIRRSLM